MSEHRPPSEFLGERHGPQIRDVRVHHLVALFVWAVVLGFFLFFFATAKLVILGILAAGCLMAALRPIARRIPGPRPVKAVVTGFLPILVLGGIFTTIFWIMRNKMRQELMQWPQVREQINQLLARWTGWMGLDQPLDVQTVLTSTRDFLTGEQGTQIVQTTASAAASVLIAIVFVLFGTIYFLLERPGGFLEPLQRMLPPRRRRQLGDAFECLEPRLRWWTIGAVISIVTVGTATYIGFTIVGLQLAVPLAMLAAIGELVPNIGPFIAFTIALLFGAAQGKATGVLIVWLVIQILESYVILPFVMNKAVKIPPFVTLVSVLLWGTLFGLPGVLLAIPLNLLVWSFAEQFLLHRYDRNRLETAPPESDAGTAAHDQPA